MLAARAIFRGWPPLVACLLALLTAAPSALADIIIPAGGQTLVDAGQLQVSCTNLIVNGTLNTGTGTANNVGALNVGASGVISGSGTIHYVSLSSSGSIAPTVTLVQHQYCGGPPVVAQRPVPTVETPILIVLAAVLLGLAGLALRSSRFQASNG